MQLLIFKLSKFIQIFVTLHRKYDERSVTVSYHSSNLYLPAF